MLLFGAAFLSELLPAIALANHSIKIVSFIWDVQVSFGKPKLQKLNSSIFAASTRGVLVSSIVRSYKIVGFLNINGVKAVCYSGKNLLHMKGILIDDNILFIGSHNLTEAALTKNVELSVMLRDKSLVNKFNYYYNSLYDSADS
jgi:phosphatidylserine/phosphatidylglycerophosphate/cardiolipin synthase-like enzyme